MWYKIDEQVGLDLILICQRIRKRLFKEKVGINRIFSSQIVLIFINVLSLKQFATAHHDQCDFIGISGQ